MRIDGSVRAALLKLIRDARQAEASGAPKILKTLTIPTTLGAAPLRSPGVPGDRSSSLGCRFIAQGCAGAVAGNPITPRRETGNRGTEIGGNRGT